MFHVSTGDMIAGFMAVCTVAGLAFSELRHMESKRQAAVDQAQADRALAAARAVKDTREDAEVTSHGLALNRLAHAQEALLSAFQKHDKEDARFHGEIEATVKALKESGERTAAAADEARAMVARLIPGDTFAELIPATNRRKVAGG